MQTRCLAALLTAALFAAPAALANFTARGNFTFTDAEGQPQPLADAQILVYDQGSGRIVCASETDAQGNYAPDYCDEAGGTYYVKIVLETAGLIVDQGYGAWSGVTQPRPSVGGVADFGSQFFNGDAATAASLFGLSNLQLKNFQRQIGPMPGGLVRVLYPAITAGVPFTTDVAIHWPAASFPDIINGRYVSVLHAVAHEFGHRIRQSIDGSFGDFWDDVTGCSYLQQHTFEKLTNPCYAFNEGWAEYHAALFDPLETARVGHWFDMPTYPNNHGWDGSHWGPQGVQPGGDSIEGNVAAELFQLSNACGGFRTMVQVLHSAPKPHRTKGAVHTYFDFWMGMQALQRQAGGGCLQGPQGQRLQALNDPARGRMHAASPPRPKGPPAPHAPVHAPTPATRAKEVEQLKALAGRLAKSARTRLASRPVVHGGSAALLGGPLVAVEQFALQREQAWMGGAVNAYATYLAHLAASAGPGKNLTAEEAQARANLLAAIVPPHRAAVLDIQREIARVRPGAQPAARVQLDKLAASYTRVDRALQQAWLHRASPSTPLPLEALPIVFAADVVPKPGKVVHPPPGGAPPILRSVSASCNFNPNTGNTHFWSFNASKDAGEYTLTCDNGFTDTMRVQAGDFQPGAEPQPGHYRSDGWFYHGWSGSPQAQAVGSCRTVFSAGRVHGQSGSIACVSGTTEAPARR